MHRPVVALAMAIAAWAAAGTVPPAPVAASDDLPVAVAALAVSGAARGGYPMPDPATCPATLRGAVVDRAAQRAWLCDVGTIVRVVPITSATDQPDPGTYQVYAEDLQTTSYYGPRPSVLDHFVAFTRGKFEGARIGFHAVPRYADGTLAEPLEAVGTPEWFGQSSGCIRLRPEDAAAVWDFLAVGHEVHVVS